MIKRILGKDLEVSAVGLGCMGLSQSYPPFPKREEGIRFLRRAVEILEGHTVIGARYSESTESLTDRS